MNVYNLDKDPIRASDYQRLGCIEVMEDLLLIFGRKRNRLPSYTIRVSCLVTAFGSNV
jgi:hypothetical protein